MTKQFEEALFALGEAALFLERWSDASPELAASRAMPQQMRRKADELRAEIARLERNAEIAVLNEVETV